MCKAGDIVIVENFKNEVMEDVTRHPFIILSDKRGSILGNEVDKVAVLLNSFRNKYHRNKKLNYSANVEVRKQDGAKKGSYAKSNFLYCFDTSVTNMVKVGEVDRNLFMLLKKTVAKNLLVNNAIVVTSNIEFDKILELDDEYEIIM